MLCRLRGGRAWESLTWVFKNSLEEGEGELVLLPPGRSWLRPQIELELSALNHPSLQAERRIPFSLPYTRKLLLWHFNERFLPVKNM